MTALTIDHDRDEEIARTLKAAGGVLEAERPALYHAPTEPQNLHTGPIHSVVAGRTDHLPMHVPSGSYVIPADIVSGHGEGNTMAGFKVLRRVFGGTPYGGGSSPYGVSGGPYGSPAKARGGSTKSVPIVAAGGEMVLSPEQVRRVGDGDLDMGHKVLDEFVKRSRKELTKTLSKLPPPKVD